MGSYLPVGGLRAQLNDKDKSTIINTMLTKQKFQTFLNKILPNKQIIQTLAIDVINSKALKLLQDLEPLQLIGVHREKQAPAASVDWAAKYKGAMTKQPLNEIDNQLNELRNAWV